MSLFDYPVLIVFIHAHGFQQLVNIGTSFRSDHSGNPEFKHTECNIRIVLKWKFLDVFCKILDTYFSSREIHGYRCRVFVFPKPFVFNSSYIQSSFKLISDVPVHSREFLRALQAASRRNRTNNYRGFPCSRNLPPGTSSSLP